jgi:hypothetical protein
MQRSERRLWPEFGKIDAWNKERAPWLMNELNASMRLCGGPEVPSIVPAITFENAASKTTRES